MLSSRACLLRLFLKETLAIRISLARLKAGPAVMSANFVLLPSFSTKQKQKYVLLLYSPDGESVDLLMFMRILFTE